MSKETLIGKKELDAERAKKVNLTERVKVKLAKDVKGRGLKGEIIETHPLNVAQLQKIGAIEK